MGRHVGSPGHRNETQIAEMGLMNGGLDSLNLILDLVEVGGVLRQSDVRVRGRGQRRFP